MKEPRDRKLDLAARAAWLYYIAGNTQEEIVVKLNVSRQAAQRPIALAVSEKLIKFRLDHRLSECIALDISVKIKPELCVGVCKSALIRYLFIKSLIFGYVYYATPFLATGIVPKVTPSLLSHLR